jgi:membrane fusion protein, macrolide-specific efflux system
MSHRKFLTHLFRSLLAVSLLLLAACSGTAVNPAQATPTPIPLPAIPVKPTYLVQRGNMLRELNFPGRINPAIKQELAFASGGRISKIYVRRGDAVTKYQLLAELETSGNGYDLRRAQANLKIAQYRLDLARLQSPQASQVNKINVAIAEQEVELAQIAFDEINAAYSGVRLVSPLDGTVFSVSVLAGGMAEANSPVIVVADLANLVVSADLKPEAMSQLTVGLKVSVEAVGRNIPTVEGTIQSLPYPYGSGDAQSSGNSVQVALEQTPTALGYQVGDMVNLSTILEKKAGVLWLPSQAVREFEGRYFVILQDGESQRRVDVKVGILEADRIEITEGVAEGQVVVAP